MRTYLIDKFEFNLQANLGVIKALKEQSNDYMVKSICHVLNAQEIWNKRIIGGIPYYHVWAIHSLDNCEKIAKTIFEDSIQIVKTEDFQRIISYTNTQGKSYNNSVEDILFHVLTHCHYHRAQVCRELRYKYDITPPDIHFITYKRLLV